MKPFLGNKKKKGQVFLMSALILASSVALGLALVSIYLKNMKMVYEVSESVRAFYAADSCAEWRLDEYLNLRGDSKPVLTNDTQCEYDKDNELLGQIETIGITKVVRRGINIYFGE